MALELEPHLNTCFRHFILFVQEFDLVDEKESAPMKELIDRIARTPRPGGGGGSGGGQPPPPPQHHQSAYYP